ncbi:MAG: hypothetical protein ACE364_01495 [Chlorobiota bacterium]
MSKINKLEVAETVYQFKNKIVIVSDSITQSSRDYISRDEVLDIYYNSQSIFNSETIVLLTIFAIGIAIIGIMIPLWQRKNLKDTERRLEKESKNNENRINRELNQYRLDINEFKKNIDLKIKNKIEVTLDEHKKELSNIIYNELADSRKESNLLNYFTDIKRDIKEGLIQDGLHTLIYSLNEYLGFNNETYLNVINELFKVIQLRFQKNEKLFVRKETFEFAKSIIKEYYNHKETKYHNDNLLNETIEILAKFLDSLVDRVYDDNK